MENFNTVLIAESLPPAGKLPVTAPFNGKLITEVATANESHIEAALTIAYKNFQHRNEWLPLTQRLAILEKLSQLMTEQQEELALGAAEEGGKPLQDSRVEVTRAIDGVKICIETMRTHAGQVIPMQYSAASAQRVAFTQLEPIGVVVAYSAFNHPVNLIVHQVATAIAAGCPVIIKPASDTPLSCLRLVKLLYAAGLPKAWCQAIVLPDNTLAEKLVSDTRIAYFSFIGSARVGWMLRSKLAAGTRCGLEHGGVAPVIVARDADIDACISPLTKGGFYHAGQVCVSVQRIFADEHIAYQLAASLTKAAQKLIVGDPTMPETEVGPIIRAAEIERINTWVQEAVENGAKLLCGGKPMLQTCYEPTVLLNPPLTAKVSTQEIFGPVVCVYAYDNIDEAITQANALPFAFQAAVFTQNLNTMLHAYQHLAAATVMINDHTAFRIDAMPFAGLKQSGLGTGGIPYTIREMQVEKLLVIKQT